MYCIMCHIFKQCVWQGQGPCMARGQNSPPPQRAAPQQDRTTGVHRCSIPWHRSPPPVARRALRTPRCAAAAATATPTVGLHRVADRRLRFGASASRKAHAATRSPPSQRRGRGRSFARSLCLLGTGTCSYLTYLGSLAASRQRYKGRHRFGWVRLRRSYRRCLGAEVTFSPVMNKC